MCALQLIFGSLAQRISGKGGGVRTRGRDNQYGSQVTIVMSAANKSSVVFILLGLSR